MRKLLVLFTLAAVATPQSAYACPVCFGQNDSPMAAAINWGVITLLLIVTAVLAAFASFFIYLIRRAKFAEMPDPAEASRFAGSDPQEGIAQC